MKGTLGQPYKVYYSAKDFKSSLTDIIALVKKPDNSTHATYNMSEFSGSLFSGTYYFDLLTTQNDLSGEYSILIYEQTSGSRQVSKVSLTLPTETIAGDKDTELFGKIVSEKLTYRLVPEAQIVGKLQNSVINGSLFSSQVKGIIQTEKITAKISEKVITYRLECKI